MPVSPSFVWMRTRMGETPVHAPPKRQVGWRGLGKGTSRRWVTVTLVMIIATPYEVAYGCFLCGRRLR
jgi:hypothetical protein